MFTLYNTPGAGGFAVQALLEEAGLDHKVVHLDFEAGEHKQKPFVDISPLGQVPTLVLPDGRVMTESAAILIHLGDLYPAAGLAPSANSPLRAEYLRWMLFLASSVYTTNLRCYHPEDFTSSEDTEAVRAVAEQQLMDRWQIIEDELTQAGPWLLGEACSIADIYAMMIAQWAPDRAMFNRQFPAVSRLCEAVRQRPATARILPQHDDFW